MSATAISASPKPVQSHTRRLLVRMNSTLFHCLGAAVLLEYAAAAQAARMPVVQSNGIQVPQQQGRAQWLRDYAASIWPEFGWEAACAEMRAGHAPHCAEGRNAHATAAAASDHTAKFYRALGSIAEDPELCRVLKDIASVEESCRAGMDNSARPGALAALRNMQSTRAYVEHTRNRVVRRAFDLLQQHWTDTPPFPAMEYDAFLSRAYALLAPHLRLDWTRRVLYRGWLTPHAPRAARQTAGAAQVRSTGIGMHGLARGPACALPRASVVR